MASSRYEKVERGILRVHSTQCGLVTGATQRCNCAPGYRAEISDRITKKRTTKTLPTKEAAQRWRDKKRVEMVEGRFRITEARTVRDAWQTFYAEVEQGTARARGATANTSEDYKPATVAQFHSKWRNYLEERFGDLPLGDLRTSQVQAYVDELALEFAPNTVSNTIVPLRVLYRWAMRRELVAHNPCDTVILPSGETARDRICSVTEALQLIDALTVGGRPDVEVAMWATAFFAGLRRGELLAMDWSCVDLGASVLRVERSWDPSVPRHVATANYTSAKILGFPKRGAGAFVQPKSKNGYREVPLPTILVAYLAKLNATKGLVFSEAKVPPHASSVQRPADALWKAAKLERITLHNCRHTYASLMIEAGVNIKAISTYMGHASVQITWDRYGHLLKDDLERTREKFDTYVAGQVAA